MVLNTTPMLPAVWEAMRPFLTETFGNPASVHQVGRQARRALEDAREKVAELLDAADADVVFTSGGTEANNLALFGLAGDPPGHLIASPVEHPCAAEPLKRLSGWGFSLDLLPVDETGVIPVESLVGARLLYGFHQVGGVRYDIPAGWAAQCRSTVDLVDRRLDEYQAMLEDNPFFTMRTRGVGVISTALAQEVRGINGHGIG